MSSGESYPEGTVPIRKTTEHHEEAQRHRRRHRAYPWAHLRQEGQPLCGTVDDTELIRGLIFDKKVSHSASNGKAQIHHSPPLPLNRSGLARVLSPVMIGDTAAKTKEEMEAEISQAMRARISDFKKQAETLTLEGVRRALETDLHLEKFSLDDYKKFIKQCLNECFAEADDETASKTPEKVTEEVMQPEQEKVSRQHGDLQPSVTEPTDSVSDLSEDMIRGAMKKRAAHIRANIEKLSLAQVRRLLEGDLKLETKALDVYKGFISNELDDILASAEEAVEATNGVKKKQKKDSKNKELKKKSAPSKSSSRVSESLGSDDAPSDDEETKEERRPKKRPSKDTEASTKPSKKQKKSMEGSKSSGKKKKPADLDSDKSSDDEGGNSSENSHSRSSTDERVKKKIEKPAQVYGKQVERLKSIIKSCGMGITPAVYKKAKQAPENKREAVLIKELEDILRKEGLSTNPSEKEIKAVKKRKATAKELEGIDTSNIVLSSRRRAASSYIPLPKPKIDVESDDESENEDEDDDEEDEEDADDGVNDGGESSEGSGQDAEDESD